MLAYISIFWKKVSFSYYFKNFFKSVISLKNKFLVRVAFYYILVLIVTSSLLMLPWFWEKDKIVSFLDVFYTTTSAISTTGLTIYDISEDMNFFGQLIIFLLIFAGGFGLIFFKVQLFKGIRYLFARWGSSFTDEYEQYFERGYFNPQISQRILKVGFVCLVTSYGLGFVCLLTYFLLVPIANLNYQDNPEKAVWSALFHSVSATNNAGFDILKDGIVLNSLQALEKHYFVQIVLISQFIFGGLGFIVFFELWEQIRRSVGGARKAIKLSFLSKAIIVSYVIVIVFSLSLVSGFEANRKDGLVGEDAMKIIFNTLSARSAGFSTVNIGEYFGSASKYLLSILMWIGCAPLSTGGGLKITTFVIMLWAIFGKSNNRNNLNFFKRNIALGDVAFVYKVGFFSLILITCTAVVVSLTTANNPEINFLDALFYSNSAMGNVGLTTFPIEIKNWVTLKLMTIFIMLIGQIGLAQTLQKRKITTVQSNKEPYLVNQTISF